MAWLYLAGLDGLMHARGTGHPDVAARIRWYEDQLGALMRDASCRYGDVEVALFSDHGMADVRATCDLRVRIAATGLRFGEDYAAVFDSTMARFWFLRDGARERIEAALGEEPLGRILPDADLAALGCDFPGQSYGSAALTLGPGDLLVLYTDGITEAANPDDEEFGLDRLVAFARRVAARPLPEIETAIGEELTAFAAGVPLPTTGQLGAVF